MPSNDYTQSSKKLIIRSYGDSQMAFQSQNYKPGTDNFTTVISELTSGNCVLYNCARGAFQTERYPLVMDLHHQELAQRGAEAPDVAIIWLGTNDACALGAPTGQHVPREDTTRNMDKMFSMLSDASKEAGKPLTLVVITNTPVDPANMTDQWGRGRQMCYDNAISAEYAYDLMKWAASKDNDMVTVKFPNIWDRLVSDGRESGDSSAYTMKGDGLHLAGPGFSQSLKGALADLKIPGLCNTGEMTHSPEIVSMVNLAPCFAYCQQVSEDEYRSMYGEKASTVEHYKKPGYEVFKVWAETETEMTVNMAQPMLLREYGFDVDSLMGPSIDQTGL